MEHPTANRAGLDGAGPKVTDGHKTWRVMHREPGSGFAYEQCDQTGERRYRGVGKPGAVGKAWLAGGEWTDTHQHGAK